MIRILSYILLVANILLTSWGVILLGGEIGASWWSSSFFFAGWATIPCVIIHFGLSRFGSSGKSLVLLLAASVLTLLISVLFVGGFVIRGPITAFSMLVYLPFPLTQVLLIVPFIWLAKKSSMVQSETIPSDSA